MLARISTAARGLVVVAALALLAPANGCAGADTGTGNGQPCVPACIPPQVCDLARRVCVDPGTSQCSGNLTWCRGACVDTTSDAKNCGSCGNTCGFNAQCVASSCRCVGTFQNCNGYWSDGCECPGGCEGRSCASTTPAACDPSTVGACDQSHYCDITAKECIPCPTGRMNCDQRSDCECEGDGCDGASCRPPEGVCDPSIQGSCGGIEYFCDEKTYQCGTCAGGYVNCNRGTFCECAGLCNGDQCASCEPSVVGSCDAVGTTDVYCDGQDKVCKKCPTGKKNCDRKLGCECDTTCDGDACKPVDVPCDPNKVGDCGDENRLCVAATNKCDDCPPGKKNCDRKGDCECDYTCDGGTCQTPCSYYDLNACGNDPQLWCYNGSCIECSPNWFNCDHTKGCECYGGCDGTSCLDNCKATCAGCCDDGACINKAAQTSSKCGSGGADCDYCPIGTFCKDGACVDCATNCPDGCCNIVGDCLTEQTDTACGKGGIKCEYCYPGLCIDGYCYT